MCEETTQGWGENHPKDLEGRVSSCHTEPGIVNSACSYQSGDGCGDGQGYKEWEGEITKGHEESFGGDGYVHYLDCEDGFIAIHICKNLSNCIP